ncbi:MAG TPA: hypothetical protein VM030_07305 [Acidimicrobiales bacterium]|nr:hypothetical protein [Acidimicrobiales bacterium]
MAPPPPSSTRAALGVAAGVVLAVVGGLVVGEQELLGVVAIVAALGFGVVMGELMKAVGGTYPLWGVVAAGVLAGGGYTYALWIFSARWLVPLDLAAKLGPLLAATVAAFTLRSSGRRGADTPSDS